MNLLKLSLISIVVAASSLALATETNQDCIPKSEMQEIAKHFTQFSSLANADFCNDDSQNWHLISSIEFMRKTQFAENMKPSQDELFSGRFASSWYDYFIGRINNLEVVSDCPKGVIAYVYMFGDKTMYTCPAALTDRFSSLDRASVMMHEARHIDGFPHMTCTRGARKGLNGACDVKIADGGSYAVTVETYAQLGKYAEGIHPALKSYAKTSAVIYADEAFENSVRINRTEHLLVLTQDKKFHALNVSNNETKSLGQVEALGHIIRRGQHLVIFPTDKNLKARYVFTNNEGEISQSPMDMVTEYNAQTPEQRAQLVDVHVGAQWNARVYANKVTFSCDPRAEAKKDLTLPAGEKAVTLMYPEGYTREALKTLLSTEKGSIYELGCNNKNAYLKPSSVRMDQQYVRVHKAAGQVFGLTSVGQLFKIESGRSTPVQTNLQSPVVEILPQQSFNFYE